MPLLRKPHSMTPGPGHGVVLGGDEWYCAGHGCHFTSTSSEEAAEHGRAAWSCTAPGCGTTADDTVTMLAHVVGGQQDLRHLPPLAWPGPERGVA